jgi:hydrogenase expression/formation protein HypE
MKTGKILLDHGSGGKLSHELTRDLVLPAFDNHLLSRLDDGAVFRAESGRFAFSTDTYTVDPLFFPGGDIGELAVNGTVNDLAMCGAEPLYLSAGLIIEEGLSVETLARILASMKAAAAEAGVTVITGDTKVVPRGAADKIFINTSGVGRVYDGARVSGHNARPGDRILLSGSIADHGATVLTQREGLSFAAEVASDTAPLNHMVRRMFAVGADVRALRDPTRGGLGTTLNEIALQSRVGIKIYEAHIPVKGPVAGICELLGFDPLYLANEGKLVAVVAPGDVDAVLDAMRQDPAGREAAVIGEVVELPSATVFMQTRIGGSRIVDMLTGEQLPRIC